MNNIKWNDNTGSVGKTQIHAWFDNESWKISERFALTGVKFSVTSCTQITHPKQLETKVGNGTKCGCEMGFYLSFWLDDAGIAFLSHLGFDPSKAQWWNHRDTWKQWSPIRELLANS